MATDNTLNQLGPVGFAALNDLQEMLARRDNDAVSTAVAAKLENSDGAPDAIESAIRQAAASASGSWNGKQLDQFIATMRAGSETLDGRQVLRVLSRVIAWTIRTKKAFTVFANFGDASTYSIEVFDDRAVVNIPSDLACDGGDDPQP